jgi:hypothetical protein
VNVELASGSTSSAAISFNLRFSEGYPGAFRTLAAEVSSSGADGVPIVELGVYGGAAAVAWEWVSEDRSPWTSPVDVSFGVVLAAKPGEAEPGTATASGNFAPVSSKDGPAPGLAVPRFADLPLARDAFTVIP